MKRIFLVMMVLAQVAVAGVALATPVTVDFSVLGSNTVDITLENFPPPLTLNGVTIAYDNFGSSTDFASADATGIYGTTYGVLSFNFSVPANALNFNFSLQQPTGPALLDNVIALFSNNDVAGPVTTQPDGLGNLVGSLAYSGAPFNQVFMYFSVDAPIFTVDHISYDPVPIPGALPLVGSGLLVLAGWGWRSRKKS
jgi:hypothetical protein